MVFGLRQKIEITLHILNCIFWILTISGLSRYHGSVNEPINLAAFGSVLTFILSFARFIAIVTNKVTQKGNLISLYLITISLVINMSRVSDIWRPCHKASVIGQDCVDGLGAYTVGTILQSIILFLFLILLNFPSPNEQRTNYQEIPGSNDATSKKINKANTTRVKDLEKNTLSSGGSKSSKSSSSSEITPSSSINSTLISDQTGKTNIPKNGKQQVSVDII